MSDLMDYNATKLSPDTVKEFICDKATNQELVLFCEMCKTNNLNPFAKEAYLVKYDAASAAQMVISEGAVTKKANEIPNLVGFTDGVIVENSDGSISDVVGEFYASNQKLVGGWARITTTNKEPIDVRVRIEDYNKNRATWKDMPARMINKISRTQCVRKAISSLIGVYSSEEAEVIRHAEVPHKKEVALPVSKSESLESQAVKRTPNGDSLADEAMEMVVNMANGDVDKAESQLQKRFGFKNFDGQSDASIFEVHKAVKAGFDKWNSNA